MCKSVSVQEQQTAVKYITLKVECESAVEPRYCTCKALLTRTYGVHAAKNTATRPQLTLPPPPPPPPTFIFYQGQTPLHVACLSNGSAAVVTLLTGLGADHTLGNNFGETPLHVAAQHSDYDTCKVSSI